MIKRTLLIGSLSILFTGCIGGKTYVHPNYSPQKWAVDKAECNAFARGAYGYNQPHQIQNNNPKQYDIRGTSYNNYGGSTNYYGTVKEKYDYNQGINNIAKGMMNVRYQNNINEAFEACLFQKGWKLKGSENTTTSNNLMSSNNESSYGTSKKYDKNGCDEFGYDKNGIRSDKCKYVITKKQTSNTITMRIKYDKKGYDKNGFDAFFIHKDTGIKFDKNGCDFAGYDKNGNYKCPY